uniref:transmembrane protein 161A isoform X2 n=1 Tax=Myodes glareolus TaxID=447135 RepID=UPI0020229A65|nr:transmembrane protein 161A isoform X2 [Myodes glareolus]
MAALGVQLVVTLFTATLMHRLAPHCSFARWLLCNGSLFRYIHPSEEELRMLAGKPRHRGRKDRPALLSGIPVVCGLRGVLCRCVPLHGGLLFCAGPSPRDQHCRVLVPAHTDFLSQGVPHGDPTVLQCQRWWRARSLPHLRPPLPPLSHASAGGAGGAPGAGSGTRSCQHGPEPRTCAEETGLGLGTPGDQAGHPPWSGDAGFLAGRLPHFPRPEAGADAPGRTDPVCRPATIAVRRSSRGAVGGCIRDWRSGDWPHRGTPPRLLLHTSFLSPLCTLWLWTKPIARDFLYQAPMRNMTSSLPSEGAFDSLRLWVLVVLCLLRLVVTRSHLQAYLCLAKTRVEQLRKEAGRIEAREIQQRVVRVYCYVTVVSLQYLTPLILTLHCTLLLKTLGAGLVGKEAGARSGGYSWALGPVPTPLTPRQSSDILISVDPAEDEAQQTAAQVAGVLGSLLTPLLLRGVLAYLIWWTAACQLLSSLFGLYFHQRLAVS